MFSVCRAAGTGRDTADSRRWEIAANCEERSVFVRFAGRHSWLLLSTRCFALKVFIFVAAGQRQGRGLPHFQLIIASRLSSLFCAIPRVSIALRRDRFESGCSSTKVSTVSHERLLRRLQSTKRNGVYVKNKSLYIKKGIMVDLRDVFWIQGRENVLVEF